jgi:peptidoglycan/xylan/chitin deacetylase (PgdA/CDA1 family)
MTYRWMRSALKNTVLAVLYRTGLLWMIAAIRLRHRIVVLTYHRVLPAERRERSFSAPAIVVLSQTFDWQMRFIRKHLRPVTLGQFVRHLLTREPFPRWTCLVTFDDGWHDTHEHALPILRRHAIPAALFVATDYIGTDVCFWQERLSAALYSIGSRPDLVPLVAADIGGISESNAVPRSREDILEFVTALKSQPQAPVESLLSRLETVVGRRVIADEDRFLTWDEVAQLADSGLVAIGSHAMSHRPLSRLPPEEAGRELRDSRRVLRDRLGLDASVIAYPNGDANATVASLAEDAGFEAGFTTERGLVSTDANRFLLQRVNIHDGSSTTPAAFLARIIGLL